MTSYVITSGDAVVTSYPNTSDDVNATTKAPIEECHTQDYYTRLVMFMFMDLLALIFLAILSIFVRRKYLCLTCCKGRPGVIPPINLLDTTERRWAFAACFAVCTFTIIQTFDGVYVFQPCEFQDSAWMHKFGWTSVFVKILNVIIICLAYYPLFACVEQKRIIAANILGILFVIPWFAIGVSRINNTQIYDSQGNKSTDGIVLLVYQLCELLAYGLLWIAYVMDLVLNIREIIRQRKQPKPTDHGSLYLEDNSFGAINEDNKAYVIELLRRKPLPPPPPKTMMEKIILKLMAILRYLIYTEVTGFRFSPRMICTAVMVYFALYKVSDKVALTGDKAALISPLLDLVSRLLPAFSLSNEINIAVELVKSIVAIFNACVGIAAIGQALLMTHTVLCYRKFTHKLIKGNHAWHAPINPDPAILLVSSMRYAGYQIAFTIYGFFAMFALLFVVVVAFTAFIVLPLKYRIFTSIVIYKIQALWPTIILSLVVYHAQRLACKFIFLQENKERLALNNRRWYHVVEYFVLVFNVVVGIFVCLKRVVFSIVFGTLLLSRLDRVLLAKGFERMDAGNQCYIAMLIVEVTNNHPVLRCFIKMLEDLRTGRGRPTVPSGDVEQHMGVIGISLKSKRLRNKWYKMVTLINNPSLVLERLQKQAKDREHATTDYRTLNEAIIENKNISELMERANGANARLNAGYFPSEELSRKNAYVDVEISREHVQPRVSRL